MRAYTFAYPILLLFAHAAHAQVLETTNRTLWETSAGPYSSITFTDLPNFTTVTTQYTNLGITFTDGNDHIHTTSAYSDGHGLVSSDGFGNLGTIHISFIQEERWLAFDFPGAIQVALYQHGDLVFTSQPHNAGFATFLGLVSAQPFDAATVWNYGGNVVAIDNIYFGPPVPAPGSIALILVGAFVGALRGRQR